MSCQCGKTFPYTDNDESRRRAIRFLKLHRQKCTVNSLVIPKKFTDIASALGCSNAETWMYYRLYRDNNINTGYEVHIRQCQQNIKHDNLENIQLSVKI
jgi:hypothetical protein